jgi:hypothetical protein
MPQTAADPALDTLPALPALAETAAHPSDDRERVAERLLRSTAARNYDPAVDIDWTAPLVEGLAFIPEHRCSLYGTRLWDALSPQQRIELGKHEAASLASVGLWFEFLLMRMLTAVAYRGDPTSRHVQYALAEIAEECRHSTMFARLVERLGAPAYGPQPRIHRLGSLLPTLSYGPAMWGAILLGEEITDRFQREIVDDERIQPLIRMVNRIHILEESRHIGFARAELTRGVGDLRRWELPYQRGLVAHIGYIVTRSLINPEVYRAVGLDPREARKAALGNPRHRETIRFGGEKVLAFLDDAGLVGSPGMHWWRESFLLP